MQRRLQTPVLSTTVALSLLANVALAEPRLRRIAVGDQGDQTVVDLVIEDGPAEPELEMLPDHRLVIDLPGVVAALPRHKVPADTAHLHRVRVGRHEDPAPRTRVVLDLTGPTAFEVLPAPSGLRIDLRSAGAEHAVPLPRGATVQPSPLPTPTSSPTQEPTASASPPPSPMRNPTPIPSPGFQPTPNSGPSPSPHRPTPSPRSEVGETDRADTEPGPSVTSEPRPEAVRGERPPAGEEPMPVGLVTIDFRDADVRTVIDLVANVGGCDVIFTPAVEGTITIRVVDGPWEEALQAILDQKGLRATRHADLILVSPDDW